MSKAVKRKVSVEVQKPSSKSRLSVFQRLGTKKSKSLSESKSLTDDFKQTLSAAVSITTKPILSKPDAVELEDADPDILEKKREEIRKELELQMKMESRRLAARKRKHAESSSSSSSSGSDSESTSSTSSSSSSDNRHKGRKIKSKRRDSSSSSDEYAKKVAKKKRSCQSKKEALKLHKMSKKHEIAASRKIKKRSPSPLAKKHRSDAIMLSPSGQKVMVKNLKISTSVDKHHRIREKEVERSELLRSSERERMRMRDERVRSRSPKMTRTRSRTPKRERSPIMRRSPSDKRNRSLSRRMDTEHERAREKEREIAREKERREALLRCQDRQRERDRISTKDPKSQRLLPRPAERAMALAAAQERSTDKDVPSYSNRSFADRSADSFEHRRHDKDVREHDRPYEKYDSHGRRDQPEYQHSSTYRRDWHDENTSKDIYERPSEHSSSTRDWEHKRSENVRPGDYSDRKDWSESTPKWTDTRKPTEKYERRGPPEYPPHGTPRNYSDRSEPFDPNATSTISKPIGGIRGRWSTWRGRGRGAHHHNDFRRPHHHTEILEERGEIYRRHINPQGTSLIKPSTITKASDGSAPNSSEKIHEEPSKTSNVDENPDGEEIADDLSEISDEADDILGQQEDSNSKTQPVESVAEKPVIEEAKGSPVQPTKEKESNEVEADKQADQPESVQTQDNSNSAKSPEEPDRPKDFCDDIELDFEEISDGELEEEARTKGLGDALGVDWASLVEESKAMLRERQTKSETSAKQRWHPDQILLDVGISYKMAGTAFAQKTLIAAYENVKHETANAGVKIKSEPLDDSNHMDVDIKTENDIEAEMKAAKVNGKCAIGTIDDNERKLVLHALPCIQTASQSAAERQRQLIFNAPGPYSRGVCTKRDIEMRRQLCNLAINESNCKTVNPKSGYENIAIKLFQKALQA